MQADIVIKPDLGAINQLDFDNAKIAIQKGEIAALEQLRKIKRNVQINPKRPKPKKIRIKRLIIIL